MDTITAPINQQDTVNQVLRRAPATLAVFNEFGIDSCCGGELPLEVAAQRDGIELEVLLARLNAVVAAS